MKNILLIDDDTHVREPIAKALSRAGFNVQTAVNADSGLASLADGEFDLLISDIIMPGIDGVQAIRQARASHPDIKIIAISGGGNFAQETFEPDAITTTAYLRAATDAGADEVLTKPFERQELIAAVNKLTGD
jgi:CheY-like chemotaxis protein